MVIAEAFQLSNDKGDTEFAYTLRTLLSEGKLIRATTERDEETGKYVTRQTVLEGTLSFLTTTIDQRLEVQFDDRIVTAHPDESVEQTRRILMNSARQKTGSIPKMDDRQVRIWKAFHRRLQPVSVKIPYAEKIAEYLSSKAMLPITARRAFNKALNIIQAVVCTNQYQRDRDADGNLIAQLADYFMALQIVAEAFRENMGMLPKATGERLAYLASQGHLTPKDLATHFGISRAAVSKWAAKLEEDSIVEWVDTSGNSFANDKALYAAKKKGQAHIQVSGNSNNPWSSLGLPMPTDLLETPDPAWAPGGAEYEKYHLHLTPNIPKVAASPVPVPVPVTPVPECGLFPVSSKNNDTPFGAPPVGFIQSGVSNNDEVYGAPPKGFIRTEKGDVTQEPERIPEPGDDDYVNPLI